MKNTTDLWFASFLRLKGVPLADYDLEQPRKVRYKFKLSDQEWKAYKLEYLGSEFNNLEQLQKQLRDLAY